MKRYNVHNLIFFVFAFASVSCQSNRKIKSEWYVLNKPGEFHPELIHIHDGFYSFYNPSYHDGFYHRASYGYIDTLHSKTSQNQVYVRLFDSFRFQPRMRIDFEIQMNSMPDSMQFIIEKLQPIDARYVNIIVLRGKDTVYFSDLYNGITGKYSKPKFGKDTIYAEFFSMGIKEYGYTYSNKIVLNDSFDYTLKISSSYRSIFGFPAGFGKSDKFCAIDKRKLVIFKKDSLGYDHEYYKVSERYLKRRLKIKSGEE